MSEKKKVANKAQDLAKTAGNVIKDTADKVTDSISTFVKDTEEKMSESKNKRDLQKYAPLSKEQLNCQINKLPKMIHVMEIDKYKKSEACKDAVAYLPTIGTNKVLEIERTNAELLNIEFYPHLSDSLYIKDPYSKSEKELYININVYFDYLNKKKRGELIKIANYLGAKHVIISYIESNKSKKTTKIANDIDASKKDIKQKKKQADISNNIDIAVVNSKENNMYEKYEDYFEGNSEPKRPELIYYKNAPDVEDFVNICMDKNNRQRSKEFFIKYNSVSDLDVSFASAVDLVIKELGIKIVSNLNIKRKVEKEQSIMYKYLIEF